MIPYGPEAAEAECSTTEKVTEARQQLADYRKQIDEDEAAGRFSFFTTESCRALANAIEDLYDSLDINPGHHRLEALADFEAAAEARA
jgi:hypothetical protein